MNDKNDKIYLTTTLPYVNAEPHIGFALELTQADILARFYREQGKDVFLNTGTDEHGAKIYEKAVSLGLSPQEYTDQAAKKFLALARALNVGADFNFIRTTDSHHVAAAAEFWRRAAAGGFIYKKIYAIKYCVGCELEKNDSELTAGRCPLHPLVAIEEREEENYFFRFSAFQDKLLALYHDRPDFVVPTSRLGEIVSFVSRGLRDFSISRLADKMPWGIPVPGDNEQVMYVWFDALVNYLSAIGWPDDQDKFDKWWPVVQLAGKDNLRQQAAMWPAMLAAVGLPAPRQIIIHGFITSAGQKMSKSLGNVVDPAAVIGEYGADALRYYLARHIQPFEDSDFTLEKFKASYNAHLANGLGNLTARVMTLAEKYLTPPPATRHLNDWPAEFLSSLAGYQFNAAMDFIWSKIAAADLYAQKTEPFKIIKSDPIKAQSDIAHLFGCLSEIAFLLKPFLPSTAVAISQAIAANRAPRPLFPRK